MSEPVIPNTVHRLIVERIDSVAELEALLLMRGEPQHWDAARLAGRLYVSAAEAADLLTRLQGKGLCRFQEDSYHYEPATEELAAAIELLAETYRTRLIPVTKLIHSKSASSLKRFADAFRFRRKDG